MAAGELAQKAADAGQRRAVLDQETYAEQVGKFGGRTPEHVQDEMGVLAGEFGVMDQRAGETVRFGPLQHPETSHRRLVPGDHARLVEDAALAEKHDDMIFPCRVGVGEPHASLIYKIEAIGGGLMIVMGTRKNEMRPHVHNFPPRLMQTAVGDDSNVLLRHLDFCGHRITSFSMMDGRKCSYTFYVNCCTGYISVFSSVIRCFCG